MLPVKLPPNGVKPLTKARRSAAPVSLKGAALRLLSRREFSRHELAQRLRPKAESAEALEQVLDEVQARQFQSDDRFTESLVHRRAHQFGARRIEYELEQHRIDPATAARTLASLSASERERALAIWQRRFDVAATDLNERARQYRFLAQRGFDGDTIAWVLKEVRKPLC